VSAVLMYQAGRYPECVRWLLAAEPLINQDTPIHVVAQFRLGLALVGLHGGVESSRRMLLLDQAARTFETEASHHLLVLTLCMRAYVASVRGDFDTADASLARSGEVIELHRLEALKGLRLYNVGMLRRYQGRAEEALVAFEESLPLVRNGGDSRLLFYIENNLAATHLELGRVEEALSRYAALIEVMQGSSRADAQMMAFALMWQLHALTIQGSLEAAAAKVAQALPHCRRSIGVRHFAGMLALLAARQGRLHLAALLVGCDEAARARRGEIRMPSASTALAATLALIDAAHAPDVVATWRQQGGALDDDATIALLSKLTAERSVG
ncbi:MAG: tetratricopeptide repeat protein, partial [Pseudomonadota bacterium]|nr:tetratricopeptide repeat protein [Pseudomonadota bacterium]